MKDTDAEARERAERAKRLAEALRENLKRRKAQARGRRKADAGFREPKPPRGG